MEKLEKTAAALLGAALRPSSLKPRRKRRITCFSICRPAETVGFGGCMTAKQMGLETLLRAAGHKVLWHWEGRTGRAPRAAARGHERAALRLFGLENAVTRTADGADRRHRQPHRRHVLWPRHGICSSAATRLFPAAMRRRSSASKEVACPLNARAGSSSITRAPRPAAATPPGL